MEGYAPDSGIRPEAPWEIFAFMSDVRRMNGTRGDNVLCPPRILVCPSDTKYPANDWDTFVGSHAYRWNSVSYFIGLHTPPEESSSWVSGDGNLQMPAVNSEICIAGANNASGWAPTNTPILWKTNVHGLQGNILLSSGAVLQLDNPGLAKALDTNSLMVNFEATPALHLLLP